MKNGSPPWGLGIHRYGSSLHSKPGTDPGDFGACHQQTMWPPTNRSSLIRRRPENCSLDLSDHFFTSSSREDAAAKSRDRSIIPCSIAHACCRRRRMHHLERRHRCSERAVLRRLLQASPKRDLQQICSLGRGTQVITNLQRRAFYHHPTEDVAGRPGRGRLATDKSWPTSNSPS